MAGGPKDSPLGKTTDYSFEYDASLLFAIPRKEGRATLGIQIEKGELPFHGVDCWTAYEFSFITANHMPVVAVLEIEIPCDSPHIIESKSMKLYFNSFNQTRFVSREAVIETLGKDLSSCCGSDVVIKMYDVDEYARKSFYQGIDQYSLLEDISGVEVESMEIPDKAVLKTLSAAVTKKLRTNLFRSLCPVTGQPDWASIYIDYQGPEIDQASLLSYLVSYRSHQGFHEQCVENIYIDVLSECQPTNLQVYARFMRRGGIDINPLRSSVTGQGAVDASIKIPGFREVRQ